MKINLVGDQVRDRIDMALRMLEERHGGLENAAVEIRIGGEVVRITEGQAVFSDEKNAPRVSKPSQHGERPLYWSGYLFKHWCGSR